MHIDYESEYFSRIYEPYVYLMTEDGTTEITLHTGEIITLFKTPEGAVKHFELMGRRPVTSVEEYYGDPNPAVDYVKVATPGKYTVVDITTNLYGKDVNTTYGKFFRNPQSHPTYGDYIGWICNVKPRIIAQNVMQCQHCGQSTYDVDIEYLFGTNHINCELTIKWRNLCTTTTP